MKHQTTLYGLAAYAVERLADRRHATPADVVEEMVRAYIRDDFLPHYTRLHPQSHREPTFEDTMLLCTTPSKHIRWIVGDRVMSKLDEYGRLGITARAAHDAEYIPVQTHGRRLISGKILVVRVNVS